MNNKSYWPIYEPSEMGSKAAKVSRPAGAPAGREKAVLTKDCINPPTIKALTDWTQFEYDLDYQMSGKLGFGFAGLNIKAKHRLLIREFARSAFCDGGDGRRYKYGTAVRLLIRIDAASLSGTINISAVAAETQMGKMQAQSTLIIVGYTGSQLAKLLPPFRTFNVEAYAELFSKMNEIKRLIGGDMANVTPVILGVEKEPDEEEIDFSEALGLIWGLTMAAKGVPCMKAKSDYPHQSSQTTLNAIEAAYSKLTNFSGCHNRKPNNLQIEHAKDLLQGMQLKKTKGLWSISGL